MSVERRLRNSLTQEADRLLPDVEAPLERVQRRHRRRYRVKAAMVCTAAVVTIVALVLGVDAITPSATRPAPAAPTQTATPTDRLLGEYVVDVPEPARGSEENLAGRWTITLSDGDQMVLVPPPAYTLPTSGASWDATGDVLRTNALIASPGCQRSTSSGSYRWTLTGTRLTFATVEDTCLARRLLFAGQPWRRVR